MTTNDKTTIFTTKVLSNVLSTGELLNLSFPLYAYLFKSGHALCFVWTFVKKLLGTLAPAFCTIVRA